MGQQYGQQQYGGGQFGGENRSFQGQPVVQLQGGGGGGGGAFSQQQDFSQMRSSAPASYGLQHQQQLQYQQLQMQPQQLQLGGGIQRHAFLSAGPTAAASLHSTQHGLNVMTLSEVNSDAMQGFPNAYPTAGTGVFMGAGGMSSQQGSITALQQQMAQLGWASNSQQQQQKQQQPLQLQQQPLQQQAGLVGYDMIPRFGPGTTNFETPLFKLFLSVTGPTADVPPAASSGASDPSSSAPRPSQPPILWWTVSGK